MTAIRIVTVVGARPQFIKAAAFSRAISRLNRSGGDLVTETMIHTGQHYDYEMSDIFFKELELPEPVHLGVGSGPHGEQTGRMLELTERELLRLEPDAVVVYGDTNSTLAASLAASKLAIPLAHVEAGLRSYNRLMPEEINRVAADHMATWLLAPSEAARTNLEREGLAERSVVVGDVMYDVFLLQQSANGVGRDPLEGLDVPKGGFALATLHRPQNTDDPKTLQSIMGAFRRLRDEGMEVALPLHPRTRDAISRHGISTDGVTLLPPVSYATMVALTFAARVILTDSGGLQKEAYWAARPCVTMRPETEWVETVESGWNRVVGAEPNAIVSAATSADPGTGRRDAYGDGHAADASVSFLIDALQGKGTRVH